MLLYVTTMWGVGQTASHSGGDIITVNREEFFSEVTLRICSSLEINTGLERVLEYLQKHLPFTQMYLYITEGSDGTSRHIARASDGTYTEKMTVTPSKERWAWVQKQRKPYVLSAFDLDKNMEAVARLTELDGNSILAVPLWVEDDLIGFLVLRAEGENRFTPDMAELMAVVSSPFAIALSNAKAHETVLKHRDVLIDNNRFLSKEILSQAKHEIIGGNSGLRNVMEMIQQVAPQNSTVLIVGETGTGKELIANAIHFASPRKAGPYIKVNCGAIPENLIDDELFGHEKGAFTGAVSEKRGRFERANGGTLFLDEIGELPLQSQVRLLRVLQSRKISRVGGDKSIPVDVRIIAATNRNLKNMISENRFREDLWFRLNVFPITVPPLRQRKEDIPALIRHFVAKKSRGLGIAAPPPIAPGALDRLMNYYWSGNVRELENMVERELICHRGGQLRFDCLCPDDKTCETVPVPEGPVDDFLSFDEAMCSHINKALKMAKGKIHGSSGAAELLGINPNTLRGKMRKLGIPFTG